MPIKNWFYLKKDAPGLKKDTIENPSDTYVNIVDVDSPNSGNIMSVSDFAAQSRPYKVYTALLTQSGGDNVQDKAQGDSITIGVTYFININSENADLTVFGAPNSNVGTSFVCTQSGTLPSIGSISLLWNTGAPVVTVLQNTIGNVWFTYNSIGFYGVNSNGLFIDNKTFIMNGTTLGGVMFNRLIADDGSGFGGQVGYLFQFQDNAVINLKSLADVETLSDSILTGLIPIEIRVYN